MSRRLAALLVPLLLLAACGDDDDTDAAAPSTDDAAAETTDDGEAADSETDDASAGGTVTIEHYSGTDEVPVDPETIVVMDLGVLLTLDALGIEADGFGSLGTPVRDEFAAAIEGPADVGTAFEPDYEAINALEPDLIIVATRSSATYPDMSDIAPTVDLTFAEDVDFLTAFRTRHEQIGQIFGIEDEVEAQLADLDARVAEIESATADAGSALVLMTAGAEVSAYGPGSRFGLVHDVLGYAPADEALSAAETHGEAVSFEFVLEAAPDVIFALDRSAAIGEEAESAEAILDNDLVARTPAAENDRIVYVDGLAWYLASNSIPGLHGILDDVSASLPA